MHACMSKLLPVGVSVALAVSADLDVADGELVGVDQRGVGRTEPRTSRRPHARPHQLDTDLLRGHPILKQNYYIELFTKNYLYFI